MSDPETTVATPSPILKMQEVDRLNLELAKQARKLAMAEVQTAVAKNENAELAYKYVVIQIYLKYGLNENDAINENGEIIKNGALAAAQTQQGA